MKTTIDSHDLPMDSDDHLMDALLHEHARAGTGADQVFLTNLDAALAAGLLDQAQVVELPAKPVAKRPSHRLVWSLGLAAAVALAAGLLWKSPPAWEAASAPVARSEAGRIPLGTDVPPELIEGTPKAINVPNLVGVPNNPPRLMVPRGTVLLSKGRKVTSSDSNPIIGTLDLVTDGDKDAGEGYFVELMEGLQWIQIDLEKAAAIEAVWIWHYHSQRRAYHDVIVQISDDPEFKTGVTTVYNNDYDNSAKLGKGPDNPYVESRFGLLVDGKGTKGRYVRLYSNGNSSNEMNHYIEVEVFGISD